MRYQREIARNVNASLLDAGHVTSAQLAGTAEVRSVTATAPCTTANLGPGFDVFALALDAFRDTVHIKIAPRGLTLEMTGPYSASVPTAPELNSAGLVAKSLLARCTKEVGIEIRIEKGIPVGKGLGSSAASAAATAVGLTHLLGLHLTTNEIIQLAADGEIASSGVAHPDNVAAAVLGGFALVRSCSPFFAVRLSTPQRLEIAIVIPDIPTPSGKTGLARAILPGMVPLGKVAQNVGGAAGIVAGILSGNIELVGKGMVDVLVEPAREGSIPGYAAVRMAAFEAGAEGVAISGAGPSMIAIVDNEKVQALSVAEAMKKALKSVGVESNALASKPAQGVAIIGVDKL